MYVYMVLANSRKEAFDYQTSPGYCEHAKRERKLLTYHRVYWQKSQSQGGQ